MALEKTEEINVTISGNEMEAYMLLAMPMPGERYTVDMLKQALLSSGVVYGIKENVLSQMASEGLYEVRMIVASGKPAIDGKDGSYQYNFKQNPNKTPQIREDGSVDYWSMNLIETVVAGQVIATYKPAVQGEMGYTVKGKEIPARLGKEMAPLKGRGFVRSNDNLTYVATTDGKIECSNNRINITNFHEIFANVDSLFGNIDFAGDVVIHGNVCGGMSVRAGGTLTVDGVVEGATLWAGKDIVLRGGVLGDNRAQIFSRGNISARFFEYAKVEAYGTIQADTLLQCEVECRQSIRLEGKKGAVIGGRVHAIEGIVVNEVGNATEVKTQVEVGIGEEIRQKIFDIREQIMELHKNLDRVTKALSQFEQMEKEQGVSYKQDPRRIALLRSSICDSAREKAFRVELAELNAQEAASRNSTVKVNRTIYPGVFVVIGTQKVVVKDEQFAVEYVLRGDKVVLKGDEIVG